jgi:ferric-dicitrate binding protein FerR (iron transport regulator)
MKNNRSLYRLMPPVVTLSALVFSLSSCGGPSTTVPSSTPTGPTQVFDATPLTILSVTGGQVLVLRPGDNEWVNGEEGMTLGVDYKIKTKAGGHATITFFEGSTVELDSVTEVSLAELSLEETASNIRIEQGLGKTISRVKKLIDPASGFEIETPAAIAAVRGTEFYVSVTKSGVTTVGNIEGLVGVTAAGVEVILTEGTRTTVVPGEPPEQPEPDVTERGK